MFLVGLTGGIGSGKSTVADRCAARGWPVVDADAIAREIVEPGEPALTELAERFGERVLDADGALDRPALARLAFADAEGRAALDAITHPRIAERLTARIVGLRDALDPPEVVVLDHPLLVESDVSARVDAVVVVLADEEVRVRRLVDQRGLDEADARARIRAQTDDATRRAVADHVLVNDADRATLATATDALLDRLEVSARGGPHRSDEEW